MTHNGLPSQRKYPAYLLHYGYWLIVAALQAAVIALAAYPMSGLHLEEAFACIKRLVFLPQVLVDVRIGGAKVVDIGLSLAGARKLHMPISTKRTDLQRR